MPCGGERRERCATQMPRNTASAASFFFHPVAQKYEFTLLLSSFTHTRANARAYARKGARVRGVGKEERSLGVRPAASRTWHANATGPPPLARRGGGSRRGGVRPLGARDAARGHTLAHGGPAKVAERKTSGEPANGSFPARNRRRWPWERTPYRAEFVFVVRTSPRRKSHA